MTLMIVINTRERDSLSTSMIMRDPKTIMMMIIKKRE